MSPLKNWKVKQYLYSLSGTTRSKCFYKSVASHSISHLEISIINSMNVNGHFYLHNKNSYTQCEIIKSIIPESKWLDLVRC